MGQLRIKWEEYLPRGREEHEGRQKQWGFILRQFLHDFLCDLCVFARKCFVFVSVYQDQGNPIPSFP